MCVSKNLQLSVVVSVVGATGHVLSRYCFGDCVTGIPLLTVSALVSVVLKLLGDCVAVVDCKFKLRHTCVFRLTLCCPVLCRYTRNQVVRVLTGLRLSWISAAVLRSCAHSTVTAAPAVAVSGKRARTSVS